jgi:peptide/nickel transport system substrate-binding protein
MTYRKMEGDSAQLTAAGDPDGDTSVVAWDMAYGAKAALVMQEYYNVYADGQSAYTPGNATRNELLGRINGSADVAVQKAAFADFQKFENVELSDVPLYYQQLYIFESNRLDRNGGLYGNDQFNYDWGILDWKVTPDKNGKKVLYTHKGPIQVFYTPWLNSGLQIASKIVFDRLLVADGSLVPTGGQLAEAYTLSEDGLTVTFDLRDGVTWHDGKPVTADDVVWSIEMAMTGPPINAVLANTLTSIDGYEAFKSGSAKSVSGLSVDGDIITVKLAKIDPSVLVTFAQFAILPKHLLDGVDPLELQQENLK